MSSSPINPALIPVSKFENPVERRLFGGMIFARMALGVKKELNTKVCDGSISLANLQRVMEYVGVANSLPDIEVTTRNLSLREGRVVVLRAPDVTCHFPLRSLKDKTVMKAIKDLILANPASFLRYGYIPFDSLEKEGAFGIFSKFVQDLKAGIENSEFFEQNPEFMSILLRDLNLEFYKSEQDLREFLNNAALAAFKIDQFFEAVMEKCAADAIRMPEYYDPNIFSQSCMQDFAGQILRQYQKIPGEGISKEELKSRFDNLSTVDFSQLHDLSRMLYYGVKEIKLDIQSPLHLLLPNFFFRFILAIIEKCPDLERLKINPVPYLFLPISNSLRNLDLSGGNLCELTASTLFGDLPALKVLDLRNNDITRISAGFFEGRYPALEEILLDGNPLYEVPEEVLEDRPLLRKQVLGVVEANGIRRRFVNEEVEARRVKQNKETPRTMVYYNDGNGVTNEICLEHVDIVDILRSQERQRLRKHGKKVREACLLL